MQSPFKRVLVYDLETGGLKNKFNSITEVAMVAIDLETLNIVEEASVMLLPYFDLSNVNKDPKKEAIEIIKMIGEPDADTGIKTVIFKGEKMTLKNYDLLAEEIKQFYKEYLSDQIGVIDYTEIKRLEGTKWNDIINIYFDKCYNPQALEVTHISREMLTLEGVTLEKAIKKITEIIANNTVGNSKPILAGHNIKKFDNPFFEIFFEINKQVLSKIINDLIIDTIEFARLKWFEIASFNLSTCSDAVGLTLKSAHRALPDTIANANFLIKMLKSLRGEGTQEKKYERKKYAFNF